jgi:hypothetical protein
MSRRVYLLGVGLALVALGLAFTDWALGLQPGVTEANVKRIKPGMTVAEAEALLGGAAKTAQRADRCGDDWTRTWEGPAGGAHVLSSADGRVRYAAFSSNPNGPQPLLARLRAWLGW